MSLFIETICLRDGHLVNLEYHQDRLERTREAVLGLKTHPVLEDEIFIPGGLERGTFKCRVTYSREIELVEYEPYVKPVVCSLKLVYSRTISYPFKSVDRSALALLFQQRGACDDILIVKQGCLTDSFMANVVLWDGSAWHTPDTPLLAGTMRASLLERGSIEQKRIMVKDLDRFIKIRLINALNPLEGGTDIPLSAVTR